MRLISICSLMALHLSIFSQTASVTVFSEMGEKFTLYLNSEPMNDIPKANVKISGLTSEFYLARIDFEDASLQDCSNSNFAVQFGSDVTYVVKKSKKGEYVLRFHSQSGSGESNSMFDSDDNSDERRLADVDNMPSQSPQQSAVTSGSSQTTTTTTSTTTNGTTGQRSENVNMGININGLNMGINMNVPVEDFNNSSSVSHSHQTTTTTTTTSTSGGSVVQSQQGNGMPAGNDCRYPMASGEFNSAKESINSKSFEDSKLTLAKQIAKANCMSCNQIKEVMGLFSFEETKLTFAKYAYDYCYNNAEYYKVNDAFTFESSIEELNKYIENK